MTVVLVAAVSIDFFSDRSKEENDESDSTTEIDTSKRKFAFNVCEELPAKAVSEAISVDVVLDPSFESNSQEPRVTALQSSSSCRYVSEKDEFGPSVFIKVDGQGNGDNPNYSEERFDSRKKSGIEAGFNETTKYGDDGFEQPAGKVVAGVTVLKNSYVVDVSVSGISDVAKSNKATDTLTKAVVAVTDEQ